LIDEYGYSSDDIAVEFPIHIGSTRKRVDLAVFAPGVERAQQNISIIVECKREEVRPTDENNGVGQLHSYVAASVHCRFGMWVGSEVQVWEKTTDGQLLEASSIPRFGSDAPRPPRFADLVPAETDLQSVFRRCHDYIYGNQGLQKEPAFNEFLKLIFCKVQDESDISNPLRFFIGNEERRSMLGLSQLRKEMDALFADVKRRYSYIFSDDDTLALQNRVLAYIVGELQRYSLIQTRSDVKGVAYEQLVGSNLRGDRGEFFTPRAVCKMASEMVLATFPADKWLTINVLDPAAGTGGFLVALMDVWREHILSLAKERWGEDDRQIESETKEQLRDIASTRLFGIDFNPGLVRAAQMNLVMHGDGSTNVFHADSLLPPGEWPRDNKNDVARHILTNYFDVVLTNPPFGSNIPIDDPHVLAQYEIAGHPLAPVRRGRSRPASVPPERLFIERCLQLLRPGGRMAIVLPDSILTNPGLTGLRRWILRKARVVASVDLPKETFQPHTGTQTSVLLLQKKTDDEMDAERIFGKHREYAVFMAMPRAVGHDRRGNPLYCRTPEGNLIEVEESYSTFTTDTDGRVVVESNSRRSPLIHNELPSVVDSFKEWVADPERARWLDG
jgi:type I restriction enzyme M protein